MKVLFTPHVEHYTIGMVQHLSQYINLWILSASRLENLSRQILLPNIKKAGGIPRFLALKTLPKLLFDIIHTNNSLDGFWSNVYDRLIITEHGWPDPSLQHESAKKYYIRESRALLRLHEIGVPIITLSNFTASMLKKRFG